MQDLLALDFIEPPAVGLAAAFEVIEGFLLEGFRLEGFRLEGFRLLGESGVPVGFEFGGDQAVVGVGA